jgi:hypothetical protein
MHGPLNVHRHSTAARRILALDLGAGALPAAALLPAA